MAVVKSLSPQISVSKKEKHHPPIKELCYFLDFQRNMSG
jgi:hypothetical protein